MWRVLFVLTVLLVSSEAYSKPHKTIPGRNQRIIKVHGPPHHNHFHGHHKKTIRGIRPYGGRDEFIRPNHPPPIPPFFNGPSTNHIKHLPRPPPHVYHKAPSYGVGFPHKSYSWSNFKTFTNIRPNIGKDNFRLHGSPSVRPSGITTSVASSGAVASGITTTYHSPTFTSTSTFVSSPPVGHIIQSDDDNGPIREIPAPNLGPKPPLEDSFDAVAHIQSDTTGGDSFDSVSHLQGDSVTSFDGVAHLPTSSGSSYDSSSSLQSGTADQYLSSFGKDTSSSTGSQYLSSFGKDTSSSTGSQYLSSFGKDTSGTGDHYLGSYGKDTTSSVNPYVSTYGKDTVVNLDAIVKDPGLENTIVKESPGDLVFGKQPTVEIANFDEGTSLDVTNLIKDGPAASGHHHGSGYEVTEHHNHLPSNDQIIKGHDGTKLYYAPDPDPSLPVHKVPPTNDPYSTPSNGQNLNNLYLPQLPQPFPPYAPGGSLSSQELFHLMNGYPTVLSQPVVAFVGQPQSQGVLLQGGGQNYYQQGSAGHYSQQGHYGQNGNDLAQYLAHPGIHDLIHNTPETHHEQEALGASSHSSVVSQDNYPQQSIYSPQNQYAQNQYKDTNSNSESTSYSEVNHNYQYEPEASESNIKNSLTVIRQTSEGTLTSETVKNLLLEDSASNELKEPTTTILQLKNIPEVPFYASLPNKKAAEALATLQAAGSLASNYMNKIKTTKEEQKDSDSNRGRRRNLSTGGSGQNSLNNDDSIVKGETIHLGREKTVVDIQKSLPLYETSVSAKNLIEDDNNNDKADEVYDEGDDNNDDLGDVEFKDDFGSETFGKRIRPK